MTATSTRSAMRILYLEDEPIIALDTADMLSDLGFGDIAMVHSLPAAERVISAGKPDVALLDVNMGHGRTSIALGTMLIEAGIPVVFATGYAPSALPCDPRALVIEKPFRVETLDRALRNVTEHRPAN